jgi:sugar/nucleoside kinase (ribokinase family)
MLRTSEKGSPFFEIGGKGKIPPPRDLLESRFLESGTTGTGPEKAAKCSINEAKEIVITHSSEVIVYDMRGSTGRRLIPELVGRTGRGDTCFGSYTSWRLRHGIEESLRFAAALTSIKMEKRGPFRGTLEDVFERSKDL